MFKRQLITLIIILAISALAVLVDIPSGPNLGLKDIKAHLGLDLQGGTQLVYQADLSASQDSAKDLSNLINVFRQRVDSLGVAEPSIQSQGSDRVIIELPGIKDIEQAKSTIGSTYELVFMTEAETDGVTLNDYYTNNPYPGSWKATDLTGRDLISSDIEYQGQQVNSEPVVSLSFNNTGREKFAKITTDNVNKRIAIVLDNKIVSAPNVQTAITDGKAVITGSGDVKEAKKLSDRLNEGMLPVPAKLVAENNIGATLGADSIKASLVAGLVGLLLIALFMILLYRLPGLIAVIALVIYTAIALALFKLIPVTLTLAGIAGFILSIGMAVDANILIFERMREELRTGKTINLAIEEGFKRAWNSIRDSNSSSLITSLILFILGTGSVKGFALTLAVGIIVSLFTAVTVSRNLLLVTSNTPLKRFIHI
jgi:preprotein translocase subunit SecD